MSNFELRPVIGEFFDSGSRKHRRVLHNMDLLVRNGRQIATINQVPGASITVFAGTILSESEKHDLETFIAKNRNGVKPNKILGQVSMGGRILDDEDEDEGDDTETDDLSDE
jgi:hypothetical protein